MKQCNIFSSACMVYKKKGLGISIAIPTMAISVFKISQMELHQHKNSSCKYYEWSNVVPHTLM
jgi:hypothetical protein